MTASHKHIRLLAMGTRGDVQPYLALGLRLQQAGFSVSLGTTADFREFVEAYGLSCVTVDMSMKEMTQQSTSRRKAKWLFLRMLMDATLTLAEGADLLIYSSALNFTAPHVAEKLSIPAIPALLQPFTPATRAYPAVGLPAWPLGGWYNALTYHILEGMMGTFLRPTLNKWRHETLGISPSPRAGTFKDLHRAGTPILYGFSSSVLPRPVEWGKYIHITGYWFLPPSPNWQPTPELQAFLDAGEPPVFIGFSSLANRDAQETTNSVLEALKRTGTRAILASGWGGLSTLALPSHVFAIESAPHDWLFPRTSAIIHHGGAGTTGASLRAGKPTIIIPFRNDQPFWASQVARLHVGPAPIPQRQLTATRLADAIRQALEDDAMRERAARLGQRIQTEDGAGEAVQVIASSIKEMGKI